MKKIIILASILLITASSVFAQSLANNEFYKKSIEFTKLSEKALADGEYDMSADYAIKAQENAALSKKYIAEMVLAYRARTALTAAKERMELADRLNIKGRDSALYADASGFFKSANDKFSAKDYENSTADSLKVIELLKDISPAAKTNVLPASYEVILNVNRRDCLWRIAEYDFVYGDPWKWKVLYEANKDTMPEPDNPSLIVPGQILKIPSIKGETRSGKYQK
ncbi:MAG: hypothetical protein RBT69_03595 [Spirochaetia bacterium]|jgi:nucleoid-associated protein YgaU|nr:hypothetical protein [Spirochaetia bacterium]